MPVRWCAASSASSANSTGIDEEALASARIDAVHSAVKAEAL
jgi:hypothetical protein